MNGSIRNRKHTHTHNYTPTGWWFSIKSLSQCLAPGRNWHRRDRASSVLRCDDGKWTWASWHRSSQKRWAKKWKKMPNLSNLFNPWMMATTLFWNMLTVLTIIPLRPTFLNQGDLPREPLISVDITRLGWLYNLMRLQHLKLWEPRLNKTSILHMCNICWYMFIVIVCFFVDSMSGLANQMPRRSPMARWWWNPGQIWVWFVSANGEIVNYSQVHLSEDLKIHAALRWIYNWSVHGAPGDTITMFEETVYFVLKKNLTMSPEWSAQLEVFSVWEQEHQVLNFRLCKENHAA